MKAKPTDAEPAPLSPAAAKLRRLLDLADCPTRRALVRIRKGYGRRSVATVDAHGVNGPVNLAAAGELVRRGDLVPYLTRGLVTDFVRRPDTPATAAPPPLKPREIGPDGFERMSVTEAARRLNRSRHTVYGYLKPSANIRLIAEGHGQDRRIVGNRTFQRLERRALKERAAGQKGGTRGPKEKK